MDMPFDKVELNTTWDIEYEHGVMSLATTKKMNFPTSDLEAWRQVELDRFYKFGVWSKFRKDKVWAKVPEWDGKVWDTRWVDKEGRSRIVGKECTTTPGEGLFAATPPPTDAST